jgi:hypothetical protein
MKPLDQQHKEELRDELMQLDRCCPTDGCHCEECLLHQIVKMEPDERRQWLDDLSLESLIFLTNYQYICLGHQLGTDLKMPAPEFKPAPDLGSRPPPNV